MSTVESTETCAQCGYQGAISSFRTPTGEEEFLCPKCGCVRSSRLATEGEDNYYKKNGDQYIWEHEEHPGFGAYRINLKRRLVPFVADPHGLRVPEADGMMWVGGGGSLGSFGPEADLDAVIADLLGDETFEPKGSYITRAAEGNVTFLLGQESDLYNFEEVQPAAVEAVPA